MIEPVFFRGDVAKVLNCTPLTIANRERRGRYPEPKRDLNGYRVYDLNDILNLQLVTFNSLDARPLLALLFDRGYKDPKTASVLIDNALNRRAQSDKLLKAKLGD